jgi:hypothetical protein
MAGNNSCGGRSMRYGTMRDNVVAIDALLADGTLAHFGPMGGSLADVPAPLRPVAKDLLDIGAREAEEIEARFPKVQRRSATSRSSTRVRYFEQSMTSESPTVWPACEVPPPRGSTLTPSARAISMARSASSTVRGQTTPTGVT